MLQIDLDLGDAPAQRLAELERRRAEPALQPLSHAAHRTDRIAVPGVHRLADPGDLAAVEDAAPARAQPGAEQQHVHIDPVAILKHQAGRRHASAAIDPEREVPERVFGKFGRHCHLPSRGGSRSRQ